MGRKIFKNSAEGFLYALGKELGIKGPELMKQALRNCCLADYFIVMFEEKIEEIMWQYRFTKQDIEEVKKYFEKIRQVFYRVNEKVGKVAKLSKENFKLPVSGYYYPTWFLPWYSIVAQGPSGAVQVPVRKGTAVVVFTVHKFAEDYRMAHQQSGPLFIYESPDTLSRYLGSLTSATHVLFDPGTHARRLVSKADVIQALNTP